MKYKGYLDHVELHIISSYSRFNTRLASSQICHMLPLDQSIIETIVAPYIHQILLIFMNEPIVMQICLYVLIMPLAKYECYVNSTFTLLCWRRGMSYRNVGVHSSQVGEVKYVNSFLNLQNLFSSSGFVKMSASWSLVTMLSMLISPFCWWSLMKWFLMLMCLVLECWTGFCVILIALSLSHSKGTFLNLIPKSSKIAFIQSNCAQQLPALMYSASAVDSATLFCLFDDHETRDLPSNWQVPLVLILSILHPP